MRGRPRLLTEAMFRNAYALDGPQTDKALAKRRGVGERTVLDARHRFGLPMQHSVRGPRSSVSEQALRDAYAHGYRTLQDVGNQFGVTRERIRQLVKRYGIDRHRTPPPKLLCEVCGTPLPKWNKNGRRCFTHRLRKMRACTCGQCGKTFLVTPTQYNSRNRESRPTREGPRVTPMFCSRQCYGAWFGTRYGKGMQKHKAKAP